MVGVEHIGPDEDFRAGTRGARHVEQPGGGVAHHGGHRHVPSAAGLAGPAHALLVERQQVGFGRQVLLDERKLLAPDLQRLRLRHARGRLVFVDRHAMVVVHTQPLALLDARARAQRDRGAGVVELEVQIGIGDRRVVAALLVDRPALFAAHLERRALAAHHVHQADLFDAQVLELQFAG